jgi:hypothetical protein
MKLLKGVNILGLVVLVVVVLAGVLGLTKSLRHEGFVGDFVMKACDRENDCPSGYRCNSQTCVKTHEFWTTTDGTTEGFDQYSELKLNGMKCESGLDCRSGTCTRGVCAERNELWKE